MGLRTDVVRGLSVATWMGEGMRSDQLVIESCSGDWAMMDRTVVHSIPFHYSSQGMESRLVDSHSRRGEKHNHPRAHSVNSTLSEQSARTPGAYPG